MKTTVHVTAEHIEKGVPEDGALCAVGLALQEVLCEGAYLYVDHVEVQIGPSSDAPHQHTPAPEEVAAFIRRFDGVEPCEACSGTGVVEDGYYASDCELCDCTGYVQKQGCEPFSFELDLPANLLRDQDGAS